MQGIFVSDLHLHSRRSIGQQRWEGCIERIRSADLVVLGGDIFDLRWSQLGSHLHTQQVAYDWLCDAIQCAPKAQWVYLLGNHDCSPAFQEVLNRVASSFKNFSWHERVWQVGEHAFLHGDILDCGGLEKHVSYRMRYHEAKPRGLIENLAYEAIIQSRLHQLVPTILHRREKTCRLLTEYLAETLPDGMRGVRRVYFGHTHVPIQDWTYQSVLFRNPGSGIRKLRFQPIVFEY